MVILYSLTLFLSACLLFFIQPMVGKMILPLLGGSSSVWNTTMLFFQMLLLVGYLYSHLSIRYLGVARQAVLHLVVILLPLITLPILVSSDVAQRVPTEGDPTFWLLGLLFLIAGLPYFVVSTSAPIFQKWFSVTDHEHAQDPYFLYAASNVGSFVGLLGYPLLIERVANITTQSQIWHIGYICFVGMTTLCAVLMFRGRRRQLELTKKLGAAVEAVKEKVASPEELEPLTARRRLWWILLAFIPSSLMLGFTTYITTDIAAVPLLWVIPLGLYLLSFILVFAARPIYAPWWVGRSMGMVAVLLALAFVLKVIHPPWLLMILHLLFYCAAIMVAHGTLAKDRPHAQHLTEFFFWVSVGGAAGGIFNALIAPLLFTEIYEYILVIALACMVRETRPGEYENHTLKKAVIAWVIVGVTALGAAMLLNYLVASGISPLVGLIAFVIPAFAAISQIERPSFFTVALVVLVLAGSQFHGHNQRPIFFERNFYGSVRVADGLDSDFREYLDGNTIHGRQRMNTQECLPLSYFYPTGPIGHVFENYQERVSEEESARIAVIGMGMGSMACYGRPNEHWDLYEINPLVVEIATNPAYFSVLELSAMGSHDIILGDGRLQIMAAPDEGYDLIFLDAFSSGSVPVHLLTREALEIYLGKLKDDGLILFNVSNRIFHLSPILADVAAALDVYTVFLDEGFVAPEDQAEGKEPSAWVVVARSRERLAFLEGTESIRVYPLQGDPGAREWTDSFSDILRALQRP